MTLGINVTKNDPEINGNNEPSGRLNLKGQQKPQYLIDAIEIKKKAWAAYDFAFNSTCCNATLLKFLYDAYIFSEKNQEECYARYNQECANE
jgi:hypothetical protein